MSDAQDIAVRLRRFFSEPGTSRRLALDAAMIIEHLEKERNDLRKRLNQEELDHENTIIRRDIAEDYADRLAYALAGDSIGEHSSINNPWANALDRAAV